MELIGKSAGVKNGAESSSRKETDRLEQLTIIHPL